MKYGKWTIWIGLLLLAAAPVWSVEFQAQWSSSKVTTGEVLTLDMVTDARETPELLGTVPDFLQFDGRVRRLVKRMSGILHIQYEFTAKKTGTFTIPPLTVKVGTENKMTPEWQLQVDSPADLKISDADGKSQTLGDLVFARAKFLTDRVVYYVGEEIPLTLEFFVADNSNLNIRLASYPEINAGKAIFRQFGNSQNPNFDLPRSQATTVNQKPFTQWNFLCIFRSLAPGKLTPEAVIPVYVSREFGRTIDFPIEVKMPELTIKALPPVPADTIYSGLVGQWRTSVQISGTPLEAGEALTLEIRFQGDGWATADTLVKPLLNWPGCRVYPPEVVVDEQQSSATLRYTFIPLEAGKLLLPVSFATFDPALGAYQITGLAQPLEIKAGNVAKVAAVQSAAPPSVPVAEVAAETVPQANLHYLKPQTSTSGNGALPWLVALLFAAGPLFYLSVWWQRRCALNASPAKLRRADALRKRREIVSALQKISPQQFPEWMQSQLLPYLANLRDLPPGMSAAEMADAVHDPELAHQLRVYSEKAYAPGSSVDWRETMLQLSRILKRFSAVLLLFGALNLGADAWSEATSRYDQGKFAEAQKEFDTLFQAQPDNAALWYNLGCCAAQQGHWAEAAWYFEGAELLNPGDNSTRENLNAARRKLLQSEYAPLNSPMAFLLYIRDIQRPTTYWLWISLGWFALWVWWSYRRNWSMNLRWTVTGILILVMAAAFLGWWSQQRSIYRPGRGVVKVTRAPLYSLPSTQNGRELGTIGGGTPVSIEETRTGFLRVRTPDQEGWMPLDSIGRLP